jgi:hypothetical protein
VLDQPVAVPRAELDELLDVEAGRIDNGPFHRADGDHPRPSPRARACGSCADLPEAFDDDCRAAERPPDVRE